MKAAINKDGTLTVFAESETEYYALRHWFDAYTNRRNGAFLGIDMEKPKQRAAAPLDSKPKSTDDSEYEYVHISYRKDCPF
jgi:hypothetical protein